MSKVIFKDTAVLIAVITTVLAPILIMVFEWVFKPNTINETKNSISTITISDELIRKKTESIVFIKNIKNQIGTGFKVYPNLIITSTNIVKNTDSVYFYNDFNQNPNKLQIVNRDITYNTAVMKVDGQFAKNSAIEIKPTSTKELDKIFVIGIGLDKYKLIREGRIINSTTTEITADIAIIPGMTGAPAFSKDGELIGMVLSANIGAQIGIIVPVRQLIDFIENTKL
jgi:S1-C subfamily serine protease